MNDATSLFAFRCPQLTANSASPRIQSRSTDLSSTPTPWFRTRPDPSRRRFRANASIAPPEKIFASRASLSWPRPTTSRLFLRRRRARKLRSPRARLAPARTRDRCRPRRRRASARPRRARASRVRRRRRRRRRAAPPRRPRLRFIVGVFFEGDASPRAPRPRPRTPRRRIRRCE